jgi:hypothetical protein
MRRLVRRLTAWINQPVFPELIRKQEEINRLRRVLHDIADSRPDQHMDLEKTPELTKWICETCRKAKVGAYPPNV